MESIDKLVARDAESALEQALIAVDATANRSYKKLKYNNERFRQFVHSNLDVVFRVVSPGLRVNGGSLRFYYANPQMKDTPDGSRPIEEIIYQVRCQQIHESELPDNIQLTDGLTLGGKSPFLLPESLILGLVVAVVVAPVNRLIHIAPQYTLSRSGEIIRLNDYCGDKPKFLNWFDASSDK